MTLFLFCILIISYEKTDYKRIFGNSACALGVFGRKEYILDKAAVQMYSSIFRFSPS